MVGSLGVETTLRDLFRAGMICDSDRGVNTG